MSLATLLLSFIFAFVGFLLSLKGAVMFLLGVLLFIALPIVPAVTNEFKKFANFHLWLATSMLGRIAIVVSQHGDLLLKRMTFDDLGVERIPFGDEKKEFEDPASALHYWMDIPFALADEKHGILFDPRHAAVGNRKAESDERGETTIPATQWEWDQFRVHEWKRGVFEMTRLHELVDLSGVRKLVDGGERAEYPKRVEEMYKHSRSPFDNGTSATRFIMILAALLGPFVLMWGLATQGGGGGGGSTVGYGSSLLWLIPGKEWGPKVLAGVKRALARTREILQRGAGSAGDRAGDGLSQIEWLRIAKILAVVLPLPAIFVGMVMFAGPLTAVFAYLVLGMGFWMLPIFSMLGRASDKVSVGFGRLLFKTGLMGYDRPVFEWTPESYRLKDEHELEHVDESRVKWYGLAGSLVGFTFTPDASSWGAEAMSADEVDRKAEVVADGGSPANSNIPAGYTRVPSMKRGSSYAAFVPSSLRQSRYYLNTGIAFSRFNDSANGEKSLNRLIYAKEKHGQGTALSDKAIIYAMVGCGVFSTLLGVFIFFL